VADHLVGGVHCAEVEDLAAGFVLGALEADEAAAVRAHLAGCPEPHPELAELGSVVPLLLEAVEPTEAPVGLKGRILAAAAADSQGAANMQRAADAQGAAVADRPTEPRPINDLPPRPVMPAGRRDGDAGRWGRLFQRPVWAGVAMAAVVAAVAIGVGYVQLRSQVDDLTAYRNAVAAVIADAGKPGASLAVLGQGTGATGPAGFAAVGQDASVTLVMHDLAPTSGAQVYEAWVVDGTNPPVPIGGFAVGATGTAAFATQSAAARSGVTLALTLEAGPGATTPTMPIIASGSALRPS
jgi:anti-sigma-K factor RskA